MILEVANWTGTVSNEWNTPNNWNINKVPGTLTHVIVPGLFLMRYLTKDSTPG
ncbi:MAG: hypothetical protein V4722_09575 [Bacteroidota bacterium]